MIEAHQNRIQQLRESFIEKMKEAEKWPGKVGIIYENIKCKFS